MTKATLITFHVLEANTCKRIKKGQKKEKEKEKEKEIRKRSGEIWPVFVEETGPIWCERSQCWIKSSTTSGPWVNSNIIANGVWKYLCSTESSCHPGVFEARRACIGHIGRPITFCLQCVKDGREEGEGRMRAGGGYTYKLCLRGSLRLRWHWQGPAPTTTPEPMGHANLARLTHAVPRSGSATVCINHDR